jgi:hypothetical protein
VRCVAELALDQVAELRAREVPAQRVHLARMRALLDLRETRAHERRRVGDPQLGARAEAMVTIERPSSSTSIGVNTPRSAMSALSSSNCTGVIGGQT